MLPLGPGTFTHNTISVPTIVARTKADLIDEHTNLIGAGVSGVRGIVKGKGGQWEERRRDCSDTAHNLLKMCVSFLHSFLILMA
jgi:hypothetical protein